MNEKWTKTSAQCYERGCVCEGCFYSQMETKCVMKDSVIELLKKFGEPPKNFITRERRL